MYNIASKTILTFSDKSEYTIELTIISNYRDLFMHSFITSQNISYERIIDFVCLLSYTLFRDKNWIQLKNQKFNKIILFDETGFPTIVQIPYQEVLSQNYNSEEISALNNIFNLEKVRNTKCNNFEEYLNHPIWGLILFSNETVRQIVNIEIEFSLFENGYVVESINQLINTDTLSIKKTDLLKEDKDTRMFDYYLYNLGLDTISSNLVWNRIFVLKNYETELSDFINKLDKVKKYDINLDDFLLEIKNDEYYLTQNSISKCIMLFGHFDNNVDYFRHGKKWINQEYLTIRHDFQSGNNICLIAKKIGRKEHIIIDKLANSLYLIDKYLKTELLTYCYHYVYEDTNLHNKKYLDLIQKH